MKWVRLDKGKYVSLSSEGLIFVILWDPPKTWTVCRDGKILFQADSKANAIEFIVKHSQDVVVERKMRRAAQRIENVKNSI